MTTAILPRRAHAIGRFVRFPSAVRTVATQRTEPRGARPTVNEGRWATLPGEYAGPRPGPLDRALPPMDAPGISTPVACAGYGAVVLHLAGTWAGHVVAEGSMDGATWVPLVLTSLADGTERDAVVRPGLWRTDPVQAPAFVRLRASRLAGGTLFASVAAISVLHRAAAEALDSAA